MAAVGSRGAAAGVLRQLEQQQWRAPPCRRSRQRLQVHSQARKGLAELLKLADK